MEEPEILNSLAQYVTNSGKIVYSVDELANQVDEGSDKLKRLLEDKDMKLSFIKLRFNTYPEGYANKNCVKYLVK